MGRVCHAGPSGPWASETPPPLSGKACCGEGHIHTVNILSLRLHHHLGTRVQHSLVLDTCPAHPPRSETQSPTCSLIQKVHHSFLFHASWGAHTPARPSSLRLESTPSSIHAHVHSSVRPQTHSAPTCFRQKRLLTWHFLGNECRKSRLRENQNYRAPCAHLCPCSSGEAGRVGWEVVRLGL